MSNNWLSNLVLLGIGILLFVGCFGVLFISLKEEKTYGKHLSREMPLFSNFKVNTALTPGETTVSVGKGWIKRQQVGFFVLGGVQQLVLDRVTITTSRYAGADVQSLSLEALLPSSKNVPRFVLAEASRIELRALKHEGGNPFFRAESVELPAGEKEAFFFKNAWFCEDGKAWEPLQKAWIVVEQQLKCARVHMLRTNGEQLSLPLTVTL